MMARGGLLRSISRGSLAAYCSCHHPPYRGTRLRAGAAPTAETAVSAAGARGHQALHSCLPPLVCAPLPAAAGCKGDNAEFRCDETTSYTASTELTLREDSLATIGPVPEAEGAWQGEGAAAWARAWVVLALPVCRLAGCMQVTAVAAQPMPTSTLTCRLQAGGAV